jgi:hypothetical protein
MFLFIDLRSIHEENTTKRSEIQFTSVLNSYDFLLILSGKFLGPSHNDRYHDLPQIFPQSAHKNSSLHFENIIIIMIFEQSIDNNQFMLHAESAKRRYNVVSPSSIIQPLQPSMFTIEPFDSLINKNMAETNGSNLINIFTDGALGFLDSDANIVSSEDSSVEEEPPKKKRRNNKNLPNKFRPYQAEKWQERFNELIEFQEEKKHCLVPHTYPTNPPLARWVKRQRYQYKLLQESKQSSMTPDRIKILEECGFIWDSHEAAWQERLKELLDYKIEHDNCLVPSNYPPNPQLATWVKCQRRQYKLYWEGRPSNMTVERIMVLERYGFEWELRSSSYSKKAAEQEAKALTTLVQLEGDGEYGVLFDLLSDLSEEEIGMPEI